MAEPDEDDDFTQLVNADISRVDLVDKAANGTRILFAKSAEGEPTGLFDGEFVREMIAKADGEQRPAQPDTVTMTGSPSAIALMLKAAAERAAVRKSEREQYVEFVKAKYSAEDKRKLAAQGHAMKNPGGEPDYPIDDQEDLGKAIHAVGRGGADHDKIRAYIIRRAREMGHADMIPDNWASDGSLKQPVAKADGFSTMGASADPGSPRWEGQDAAAAGSIIERLLALLPDIDALAAREGTEVGAGHMDDLADVCDLHAARDAVTQAAKLLGGFQVAERAESGAVAKATTPTPAALAATPQESTVTDTQAAEATAAAPAAVAKGDAVTPLISEEQMAAIYKKAAEKAARRAIKKAAKAAAQHTSGATSAPEDARTIPGTDTVQAPTQTQAAAQDEVTKAAAAQLSPVTEAMASVAKQLHELATQMGAQQDRVEKALAKPDDRRSPALNGASGEPMLAERGTRPTDDPRFQAVIKAVQEMPDGPDKAQLQHKIALGAIKGTMGHAAEVAARFSS